MGKMSEEETKRIRKFYVWLHEHEGEWRRTVDGIVPVPGKYMPPEILEFGKKMGIKS